MNEDAYLRRMSLVCGVLMPFSAVERAEAVSQDVQLCVFASQSAAFLTVHALKEDGHGEAFRTLPALLNALLALSIALQTYIHSKDPTVFVGSKKKVIKLHGRQLARSQWSYLSKNVDNAIYRIVIGYYEHLHGFKLPPEHAAHLQNFLE
mmetsp:Transcript_35256/g.68591  ORF Transcript_35256/g.68591 Transcript_35256/m.68591 type:complete len:150 (+) Transcript_35256:94-543(+)